MSTSIVLLPCPIAPVIVNRREVTLSRPTIRPLSHHCSCHLLIEFGCLRQRTVLLCNGNADGRLQIVEYFSYIRTGCVSNYDVLIDYRLLFSITPWGE